LRQTKALNHLAGSIHLAFFLVLNRVYTHVKITLSTPSGLVAVTVTSGFAVRNTVQHEEGCALSYPVWKTC